VCESLSIVTGAGLDSRRLLKAGDDHSAKAAIAVPSRVARMSWAGTPALAIDSAISPARLDGLLAASFATPFRSLR
jgi:hypothetical protein